MRLSSRSGISLKKARRDVVARLAVQHAALREREIEPAPRARQRHVHQPPLLFHAVGFGQAVFVREQAFLEPADEDAVEFQAFRRMHGHQLQRVRAGLRLVLARFERGVREKRGRGSVSSCCFVGDEAGGGIDQFRQVFEAVGAFALVLVMLLQSACSITCSMISGSGRPAVAARMARSARRTPGCL